MPFDAAEAIIERWGRENRVPWVRSYRDECVCSADIALPGGVVAQLWLEPIAHGEFAVKAWDRRERRHREASPLAELDAALSRALAAIRSWGQHA